MFVHCAVRLAVHYYIVELRLRLVIKQKKKKWLSSRRFAFSAEYYNVHNAHKCLLI